MNKCEIDEGKAKAEKNSAGLAAFAQSKIGTAYAYGAKGEILTEQLLERLIRENPAQYTSDYIKKTRKNLGRICVDCSGLISWYTGIKRGSSGYLDTAKKKVLVSQLDESMKGWAMWRRNHIGIYVGNQQCVEAKGVDYGVVLSDVRDTSWEYVIKLEDICYDISPEPEYASGWNCTEQGWMYYDSLLTYKKDCWMETNDGKYHFDSTGIAQCQSWYAEGEDRYYFGPDCRALAGLCQVDKKIYLFDSNGRMDSSPQLIVLCTSDDGSLVPMDTVGKILSFFWRLAGGKT